MTQCTSLSPQSCINLRWGLENNVNLNWVFIRNKSQSVWLDHVKWLFRLKVKITYDRCFWPVLMYETKFKIFECHRFFLFSLGWQLCGEEKLPLFLSVLSVTIFSLYIHAGMCGSTLSFMWVFQENGFTCALAIPMF